MRHAARRDPSPASAGRSMTSVSHRAAFAAGLVGLIAGNGAAAGDLRPVGLADLCVTNGEVTMAADGRLRVETSSSRAVLRSLTDAAAEIDFRYLGPTTGAKPLASGELRRQI